MTFVARGDAARIATAACLEGECLGRVRCAERQRRRRPSRLWRHA